MRGRQSSCTVALYPCRSPKNNNTPERQLRPEVKGPAPNLGVALGVALGGGNLEVAPRSGNLEVAPRSGNLEVAPRSGNLRAGPGSGK